MLARQRQRLILEEVRARGAVRVADLVERFGVSDMTVRRDLDVLAGAGHLEKVHGGATIISERPSAEEPGFEVNSTRQLEEKEAIARAAVTLVRPGSAVGVTAGTTTWRLAHELGQVPGLTVVTNSIPVADVLRRGARPDVTVVLTGGIRTPSDALVGPVAVATLRSLHVDLVLMGVHGMAERAGYTTPNLSECETNQAFAAAAGRLVVLADHSKWGIRGLATIAPLEAADVLVTDPLLPEEARLLLAEHVGEVVVAVTERDRAAR